MTAYSFLQITLYSLMVGMLAKPMGWYMYRIHRGGFISLNRVFRPVEYLIYKFSLINPDEKMDWKQYLRAMVLFNLLGVVAVYAVLRTQHFLPLNPQQFNAVDPYLAWNIAISFTTNTNWQSYCPETTLSYFSQMFALTVQNFLSASTGIAILLAFIRGIINKETTNLGNFWVDVLKSTLYVFLPLAVILSIVLVSQGVIQNHKQYQNVQFFEKKENKSIEYTGHIIPMGPAASQIAIKQLGSNGGGFFNTNASHPYENPTPLTNFLEMLAILLIPAGLCYTFGMMTSARKQGRALLITMMLVFVPLVFTTTLAEYALSSHLEHANTEISISLGNMEGKETRFGVSNSSLWAIATTATSNGSVNSMHESFSPLASFNMLFLMQLGEVIFGGVGSGLYGILIYVIITVFVAGLMIGRTPSFLGKRIDPFEMKMASIIILTMPLITLVSTALSLVIPSGLNSLSDSGPHGFSEILYAFTSMANNNGSSFAGINANTPFYNILGSIVMLIGRYGIAIPVLAIAGSLSQKKSIVINSGTLPTDTPLFICLLIGVVLVIGALTFFPALSLGPIAEQLFLRLH